MDEARTALIEELDKAASKWARSLACRKEDTLHGRALAQLRADDEALREARRDVERLDAAAKHVGNIDLFLYPVPGCMMSNPWICTGANLRECLDRLGTEIDAARKDPTDG